MRANRIAQEFYDTFDPRYNQTVRFAYLVQPANKFFRYFICERLEHYRDEFLHLKNFRLQVSTKEKLEKSDHILNLENKK